MKNLDVHNYINITLGQAMNGGRLFIKSDDGKKIRFKLNNQSYNGKIIRLKGLGNSINGTFGDLYLQLRIVDHPLYKIDGIDLVADLVLDPVQAEMGTTISVTGPDEKKLDVKVLPKTKNSESIVFKNLGLTRDDEHGDLIFKVKIIDLFDYDLAYPNHITYPIILN